MSCMQVESNWAWHMPAMLGCSTLCPRCQHQFVCCPPTPCCNQRRSMHGLSGGGLVTVLTPTSPCQSPQISPSVPLAFVLPPLASIQFPFSPPPPTSTEANPDSYYDLLKYTVQVLHRSGWYYQGISYQQSQELLKDKPVGTFLVRDSSDPRFLYSLSVQTEKGPTSVRLHYVDGHFRLDAQVHLQADMPRFPGVVELIEHYVKEVRASKNGAHVWVDTKGKWYSSIVLDKPLRKDDSPPSLKHLSRLAIHSALKKTRTDSAPHKKLELPSSVISYLDEYPYSI
ncbi:SH2 domain [Popillia japonica]|uniref:SH2 domain n=1 Tax=Popillia japonica TaxID=7064 RepID=A0AAW1JHQ9_POPJA